MHREPDCMSEAEERAIEEAEAMERNEAHARAACCDEHDDWLDHGPEPIAPR
jgi:hypothetical protein